MTRLTPLRAIRAKCLDCAESTHEVRHCPIPDCPLWPYRMGHNPARRGIGGNVRSGAPMADSGCDSRSQTAPDGSHQETAP